MNNHLSHFTVPEMPWKKELDMAKDPAVGPVTLYDAFGNPLPVLPPAEEVSVEIVEEAQDPAKNIAEEPVEEPEKATEDKEPSKLDMINLPGLEATLNALKMPDLRQMAKQVGVMSGRTKAKTIERILIAFTEMKASGEGLHDLPDDWQVPPPPIPPPGSDISYTLLGAPPSFSSASIQKSVRVRRIEAASGKKSE